MGQVDVGGSCRCGWVVQGWGGSSRSGVGNVGDWVGWVM